MCFRFYNLNSVNTLQNPPKHVKHFKFYNLNNVYILQNPSKHVKYFRFYNSNRVCEKRIGWKKKLSKKLGQKKGYTLGVELEYLNGRITFHTVFLLSTAPTFLS